LTANENEKKNGSEDAEMSDSSSERKSAHKNGHFREPREDSPERDNSTKYTSLSFSFSLFFSLLC